MLEFNISIAGEINRDLIFYGLPASMPTERELLATDFTLTLGSSSAILAHNLATLGKVGFITRLGSDSLGAIAIEQLTTKRSRCEPRGARRMHDCNRHHCPAAPWGESPHAHLSWNHDGNDLP
jgi:hypothetical protein